jgi:hypothetical protein
MITLEKVDVKAEELTGAIVPVMERAGAIVVSDAGSFETAGNTVKELTALEKQIKAFWEDDVSSALKLHRSLVAKRDSMLGPVGDQKKALTNGMKAWSDEQERIRREAQAKAEAEARRMAEEAALARAVALEASGNKKEAEAVMEAPVVADPVYVENVTPTGFGQFTRKTWSAEVVDIMALVKAVANGKAPIKAIEPNMTVLNQMARSMKETFAVEGARAVER